MNNPLRRLIDVGNSFIFKGDYCTVKIKKFKGFWYEIQGCDKQGFMTYQFYTTTRTYKSRN